MLIFKINKFLKKYKFFFRKLIKILFIDKYIQRFFGKDLGIIKVKQLYILDIPKSGSSTIKDLVVLDSKRYRFCKNFLGISPKHPSVKALEKVNPIKGELNVYVFLRPPEERLYSLYNQKVLNFKNFPLGFSLLKKEKFYLAKSFNTKTQYNHENNFLEFCNGIKNLNEEFLNKGYSHDLFDKHIFPQFQIILNLKKTYNNFNDMKFIIYPLNKLNFILGSFLGKKIKQKLKHSNKSQNKAYLDDINNSDIINYFYKADKLLYEKLISSPNGYLRYTYDDIKHLNKETSLKYLSI